MARKTPWKLKFFFFISITCRFIWSMSVVSNRLIDPRPSVNFTVLMAVSKFKGLAFRARARRANTKYRRQIESETRRLKLSGRSVQPLSAGSLTKLSRFRHVFCSFPKQKFSVCSNWKFSIYLQNERPVWIIKSNKFHVRSVIFIVYAFWILTSMRWVRCPVKSANLNLSNVSRWPAINYKRYRAHSKSWRNSTVYIWHRIVFRHFRWSFVKWNR